MKEAILVLFFALGASCVSKEYAQDMLPDGKTWMVKAYKVPCTEAASCKSNIKAEITARGKLICGAQPFRVISCDNKNNNYGYVEAHCLLKCGERPSSVSGSSERDNTT